MDDLISRQAAIEAVENAFDRETILNRFVRKIAISAIRLLPSTQPQSCKDAVSKADVLETYAELYDVFDDNEEIKNELHKIYDKINALQAAQPQRIRGEWIPVTNGRGGYECDQCHNYAPSYQDGVEWLSDFCPNCGADMRGESDG